MSEADPALNMALDMAERLFAEYFGDAAMRSAREGIWPAAAWDAVAQAGLPLALVGEGAGGVGLDPVEACALARIAGRHALPLPLAETMIANAALAAAGLPTAPGVAAFVPVEAGLMLVDGRISGTAARVPWGGHAGTLVIEVEQDGGRRIARLEEGWSTIIGATNLAAMPRDTLHVDTQVLAMGDATGPALQHLGVAIRTLQIAGALERVLALTIDHVSQREQFGRSLSKFQAVQHELAKLACEAAAASAAADMAAAFVGGGPLTALAAARIRSGEAVGIATSIAQQLHGAIGFTQEHRLHWHTTALWSWRDEYGGQAQWTQWLGAAVMARPGADFWSFLTEAA